jgi:hypothetical protein
MRDFKSLVLLRSRTSTVNFLLAKTEFPARLGAGNFPVTAWKNSHICPEKCRRKANPEKFPAEFPANRESECSLAAAL